MEGDQASGGETQQYTDVVLQSCASETYMLLTSVTLINLI